MPASDQKNQIGTFDFISLRGFRRLSSPTVSVRKRSGVAGVAVQQLARQCDQFELISLEGCPGATSELAVQYGWIRYRQYLQYIGQSAKQLTVAGHPWDLDLQRYFIVDVELMPDSPKPLVLGLDKDGQYRATVEARWIVQPIHTNDNV